MVHGPASRRCQSARDCHPHQRADLGQFRAECATL